MVRVSAESPTAAKAMARELYPDRTIDGISLKLFDPRGRDIISAPRTPAFTAPDKTYHIYVVTWGYYTDGAYLIYAEDPKTGATAEMFFNHAVSMHRTKWLTKNRAATKETGHELVFYELRRALLEMCDPQRARQLKPDTDSWVRDELAKLNATNQTKETMDEQARAQGLGEGADGRARCLG